MKTVVVTGASTGIGWGCVKVLAGHGFHVFGSVRKQADADRLTAEFGAAFTPLVFDITEYKKFFLFFSLYSAKCKVSVVRKTLFLKK